jgi:hypothetical protein
MTIILELRLVNQATNPAGHVQKHKLGSFLQENQHFQDSDAEESTILISLTRNEPGTEQTTQINNKQMANCVDASDSN